MTAQEGCAINNNGNLFKQLKSTREIYYKNSSSTDFLGRSIF